MGPNRFKPLGPHQNRFELASLSISATMGGFSFWAMFGTNVAILYFLGVKISEQYLNILSMLRGEAVNIQYQYLQERENQSFNTALGQSAVSLQSAAVFMGTSRWISHGALEGSSPRGRGNHSNALQLASRRHLSAHALNVVMPRRAVYWPVSHVVVRHPPFLPKPRKCPGGQVSPPGMPG